MWTVTVRELKKRTAEVLRRVRSGEPVTVAVRGVPVAQLVPIGEKARAADASEKRKSKRALIQSIGGKYRRLGTVEQFLGEKMREMPRDW